MLFNEPKLLKLFVDTPGYTRGESFSALQRAEIAEIVICVYTSPSFQSFSALQRAEIAEISDARSSSVAIRRFSALQRAEIAEIHCMVCII